MAIRLDSVLLVGIVHPDMSRRRVWPVVLVGVLLMLAHVCALPAEAVTAASHEGTDEHGGHDESLHAGSCEAAVTSVAGIPMVPSAIADRLLSAPSGSPDSVSRDVASTGAPPSPPLFLLHAALLI